MATLSQQARKIAEEYIKKTRTRINVKHALLFGSASRDTMTKDSDIDLIVISPEFESMPLAKRLTLLARLRGRTFIDWPMDIFGYTQDEFDQLATVSSMFAEAKKQGIVIP